MKARLNERTNAPWKSPTICSSNRWLLQCSDMPCRDFAPWNRAKFIPLLASKLRRGHTQKPLEFSSSRPVMVRNAFARTNSARRGKAHVLTDWCNRPYERAPATLNHAHPKNSRGSVSKKFGHLTRSDMNSLCNRWRLLYRKVPAKQMLKQWGGRARTSNHRSCDATVMRYHRDDHKRGARVAPASPQRGEMRKPMTVTIIAGRISRRCSPSA
ncbi:MAG: hypothetical protein ACI8PT_003442 [Gammaproteobacteria bacterium]|jgi:hypothetical protein